MVATIVVTVMGALCGLGVPGAVASGDDEDFPPSNGELGVYPDYGPSRQTFFDKGGRWRDGWCRRGEGYAVVVDFSDAPEGYRGDLTPTSAHIRQFGPTVADGWIVRCHEGPYGANVTSSSTAVDWSDALSSVGLFTKKTQDYKRPDPENTNEAVSDSAVKELLHVRGVEEPISVPGYIEEYVFNPGVWIRPDASGGLSGGWPLHGSSANDPWPSAGAGNRILFQDANGDVEKSDVVDGTVLYIAYGKDEYDSKEGVHKSCFSREAWHLTSVCLGEAARYPRMYPRHPERTLTPRYADDKPKPVPTPSGGPRPRPSAPTGGPTRDPSGNRPHPHRPRHHRRPTPHVRPHPDPHHNGSTGRGGSGSHHGGSTGAGHGGARRDAVRRGNDARRDVHAGGRVNSKVGKAPRTPHPSASSSQSASPLSSGRGMAAGRVPSSASGGRVWGGERKSAAILDDHRRVPGWAWGAGGVAVVAAAALVWWLIRGRRRGQEGDDDDEVGTDLFE